MKSGEDRATLDSLPEDVLVRRVLCVFLQRRDQLAFFTSSRRGLLASCGEAFCASPRFTMVLRDTKKSTMCSAGQFLARRLDVMRQISLHGTDLNARDLRWITSSMCSVTVPKAETSLRVSVAKQELHGPEIYSKILLLAMQQDEIQEDLASFDAKFPHQFQASEEVIHSCGLASAMLGRLERRLSRWLQHMCALGLQILPFYTNLITQINLRSTRISEFERMYRITVLNVESLWRTISSQPFSKSNIQAAQCLLSEMRTELNLIFRGHKSVHALKDCAAAKISRHSRTLLQLEKLASLSDDAWGNVVNSLFMKDDGLLTKNQRGDLSIAEMTAFLEQDEGAFHSLTDLGEAFQLWSLLD